MNGALPLSLNSSTGLWLIKKAPENVAAPFHCKLHGEDSKAGLQKTVT
jgi:hypothetical protein